MISKEKTISFSVFLLLYYIYMNSIRKVMIPMSSITIPIILVFSLVVTIYASKGRFKTKGMSDEIQCLSWILISIYILINNYSLTKNLIGGGMIQLYVMVFFMLFTTSSDRWFRTWIKYTKIFIIIHAVSTIIFFFNEGLYIKFVNIFFLSNYYEMMKYYYRGWMSGLSGHFSSNGMILSIGLIFFFEEIRILKKDKTYKYNLILNYICILIVIYALILSSKRGPLISACLAIIITYIFAQGKNIFKRLIILTILCMIIYLLYKLLLPIIPGIETIMEKFNSLSNDDAGVLNGREGLWKIALDMFHLNPLTGKGFGSYSQYSSLQNAISTSAHNYYLQVLAELGLIGIVLYISAFISGIINTLHELKKAIEKKSNWYIMMLSISLEIQIFVIAYSMTSTAMMYYDILIPYFLACTVSRVIKFKN